MGGMGSFPIWGPTWCCCYWPCLWYMGVLWLPRFRGGTVFNSKVGFRNVAELDAWETTMLGPIKVTAAPGKHGVPEVTYVLEYDGFTVYFGGDTLFIPELSEIATRFPQIDLALLSVNGLRIRPLLNRKVVMDPQEAAQLC